MTMATSPQAAAPFQRDSSIDINSIQRYQRNTRRSSRNSLLDGSLDLTLSSLGTQSSGDVTASESSQYLTHSSSLTSSHESAGSHNSKWGNYSVKLRANNFVAQRCTPLEEVYKIGDLLGEGGYGEVYRCWHLGSNQERAVKVIPKNVNDAQVVQEFLILKDCDHPNLLKVYECLDDAHNFYIVSEIMSGGELYDEFDRCGQLIEEDVKVLLHVLLTCINYCHQKGLVHRDLKPENILLEQNHDFHQLKIIDFGLAQRLPQPVCVLTDREGSKYYMSPQVLQGRYSSKCDIWSLGVIAYIMLGGYAPFDGATEEEIHQAILQGEFDFEEEAWRVVSDEAKEFIMELLTYDEVARPTAEELLNHPWLQKMRENAWNTDRRRRSDTRACLVDLQTFQSANSKLKQATCAIIASQFLSKQETEDIDQAFRSLDISGTGSLNKEDLKRSYQDYFQGEGSQKNDKEMDELIKQVNFSGSGAIEYSEFVIATMMVRDMIDDDKLHAAFDFFDREGKGHISAQNLKDALHIEDCVLGGDAYVHKRIMSPVDADGNGVIDFEEFKAAMVSRNVKRSSVKRSSLRRSSRHRLSLTKQQIVEEILADDSEDEVHKAGALVLPQPSRRGSVLPLVAETAMEESEEEDLDDDSETEEEYLSGPDEDIDDIAGVVGPSADPPMQSAPTDGKRRKARSCRHWDEVELVHSPTAVSFSG